MKNPKPSQLNILLEECENAMKAVMESMEEFQPIIEFQRAMKPLQKNNLRLDWDISIVQGEDSPFVSIRGTSSMPSALHEKMVPLLPSNIEDEISQKIVTPLIGRLLDKLAELESEPPVSDE